MATFGVGSFGVGIFGVGVAAGIGVAVDDGQMRVGIQLTGWAADIPTVIYRVTPDGVQMEVRGGAVTPSGGATFVWDYEAPTGVDVYYVASDSGNLRVSDIVQVVDARSWLRSPGLPGLDLRVWYGRVPARTHARPVTYLAPLGRRTTIPVGDTRRAPTFTLDVTTLTGLDADSLIDLAAVTDVAYVLFPGTRLHGTYVSLGDVTEQPNATVGPEEVRWTIQAAEVARPVGGMSYDPGASWQAVADNHATWQAVLDTYPAWLDVLRGVPGL